MIRAVALALAAAGCTLIYGGRLQSADAGGDGGAPDLAATDGGAPDARLDLATERDLAAPPDLAAAKWTKITNAGQPLFALAGTAGGDLLAVGGGGLVLRSKDAGASWQMHSAGGGQLNGAWTSAGGVALTVGNGGTIFRSTDGGDTWSQAIQITGNNLHGVASADGTNAWAVGDGGQILRTRDGTTWTFEVSNTGNNLFGVWAAPGDVRVVGQSAVGAVSKGDGVWQAVNTMGPGDLDAMWGDAPNDVWAAGRNRGVVHSTAPNAWAAVDPGIGTTFYSVGGDGAGTIYVGASGALYRRDPQAQWTAEIGVPINHVTGLWAQAGGAVVLVTDGGDVYRKQ